MANFPLTDTLNEYISMMRLIYRVISSPIVSTGTQSIVYPRNSQMASSLSQIHVLCGILTMSSFPLEIEKNIQVMKISRFLQ